jgi:uncharacterized C2H2 Zn-finger protein
MCPFRLSPYVTTDEKKGTDLRCATCAKIFAHKSALSQHVSTGYKKIFYRTQICGKDLKRIFIISHSNFTKVPIVSTVIINPTFQLSKKNFFTSLLRKYLYPNYSIINNFTPTFQLIILFIFSGFSSMSSLPFQFLHQITSRGGRDLRIYVCKQKFLQGKRCTNTKEMNNINKKYHRCDHCSTKFPTKG